MVIEIVSFFPLKMGMFHSYVSHNQRVILGVFMDPMWIHEIQWTPGWDNMMQTSFVLKNTIRPTFNHTFYFPVRFFNEKITSRKYLETAFLYEMRSKGDIQIQAEHRLDLLVSMMFRWWWFMVTFRWWFLWWCFDDDYMFIDGDFLWWCLVMKLMKHVVWCRHLRSWVDDCFGGLDSRFVHEDHREWSSINWNPFLWRAFEHCSLCERF